MAFNLLTPTNTIDAQDKVKPSALATTKGALYIDSLTTGALVVADAATTANQTLWLANETITSGEARTTVHAYRLINRLSDIFLVDTINNSNAAHNGQRMVLGATGLTLNNTGTDAAAGVFQQLVPVGPAADRKILAVHV